MCSAIRKTTARSMQSKSTHPPTHPPTHLFLLRTCQHHKKNYSNIDAE